MGKTGGRFFCWWVLLGGLFAAAQDLDVPLRVVETAGVARTGEYVTSGVPLPEWLHLLSPAGLTLTDDQGRPVPVQFRVLSRWRGRPTDSRRPIKWLLLTFPCTVGARQAAVFHLRRGPRATPPARVTVKDVGGAIRVDTGALVFTVSKTRFRLFDTVAVGGRVLMEPDEASGFYLRDYQGRLFHSAARPPDRVDVEEAGPLRAVLRVEGRYAAGASTLLRYIVRIHAYAGRTYLRVFHALRNDGSYGYRTVAQHAYFQEAGLALKLLRTGTLTATFRDEAYTLSGGALRTLEQDMAGAGDTSVVRDGNLNLHDNFVRRIRDERGRILTQVGGLDDGNESGRDLGYLDLGDPQGGLTVSVRHFWQNFPKALTARADGLVRIELWPPFGQYVDPGYYQRTPPPSGAEDDYTFGGGRQKTHEIWLHFRTTPPAQAGSRRGVLAFQEPLAASAPPEWVARSGAVELTVAWRDWERLGGLDGERRRELARYERFQRVRWDRRGADPVPSVGRITFLDFRRRGGPYGGRQFYGWMNFGDLPWGAGYAQGHYDWAFAMLLAYLRTDERAFLRLGEEMARHRMDIDQYHTLADQAEFNGGQRFEKGEHHGDMTVPPTPSHTWIHGLLLYWALTGDEFAREAAAESLGFYRAYWSRHGPPYYGLGAEVRIGGWSLMGLTELYDYLGETEALTIARKIVTAYVNREKAENTQGWFLAGSPNLSPWMTGIFLTGLGKYYFHTGMQDETARKLMDRIAAFLVTDPNGFGPLVGGQGPVTNYTPYAIWYRWHPDPKKRKGQPRVNLAHLIDGLAYAYLATGKEVYLKVAQRCAGDVWRYWTTNRQTVDRTNPAHDEPITMRPANFPNSESKVLGWLGRYGHVLAYATYMHELMPPVLVEVEPRGPVSGPVTLRIRVTGWEPVLVGDRRRYDGRLKVNGVDQTWVVRNFFWRHVSPFAEVWYAPLVLPANRSVDLEATVWRAPWVHQVRIRLERRSP